MSKHDPHVTLLQVYDFTKEGIDLATQGSLGRLDSDRAYLRAAERIIYLIGEAASRLPDELRSAHPEIPWAQIIGMRMRLAHGYESISKSLPLPSSIPLRAAPQADRLCHPSPTRTLRLFQPEPIPIKPWTDPPPKTTPSLQQLKGRSKHALRPRWPGPAASSKSWPPASSAAIRAIAKPRPTLQAARISGITSDSPASFPPLLPVVRMRRLPRPHPCRVLRAREVIAVLRLLQPAPLALRLARLPARPLPTVPLPATIARIRQEELLAVQAFASAFGVHHTKPATTRAPPTNLPAHTNLRLTSGRRSSPGRKNIFLFEVGKKSPGKKNGFQTATPVRISIRRPHARDCEFFTLAHFGPKVGIVCINAMYKNYRSILSASGPMMNLWSSPILTQWYSWRALKAELSSRKAARAQCPTGLRR